MTRTYQCFLSGGEDELALHHAIRSPSPIHESPLSSPALAALDEALTAIHELPGEGLDWDDENDYEVSHDEDVDGEDEGCDDLEDDDEEDSEWDECMRRRMMFLQYARQETDRQPQFDGYRSISSTIVDVLRSVGCDQAQRLPLDEASHDAMISAENLKLVEPCLPPTTPSLTSASTSEDSEAETLVNSDNISIPILSPAIPALVEDMTIKVHLDDRIPASASITPTPAHPQLPTR